MISFIISYNYNTNFVTKTLRDSLKICFLQKLDIIYFVNNI